MRKVSRVPKVCIAWLSLFAAATSAGAEETLLGVHGGQGDVYGGVSIVDQDDASLTLLDTPYPNDLVGITGIATNSEGRVFVSTGSWAWAEHGPRLLEIDPVTGALIEDVGRLRTQSGSDCWVSDLSFQPGTDVLYGVLANQGEDNEELWCGLPGEVSGNLLTINTNNARVTVIGRDAIVGNSGGGIAFAGDGTLYYTPCGELNQRIVTLDPSNAEILTSVDLQRVDSCYEGLAVRPSDGTLFGSFNWYEGIRNIVTLNPANGRMTQIGLTGDELIHDLSFTNGFSAFVINQGVTDAWFNDATAGQGFLIVVFPDQGIIFLAWFTYDTERPPENVVALLGEAGHRWVTAQGPFNGDTANLTVYLTQGGVFDMAEPPAVTDVDNPIGTITIVWHSCSSATLTYDIDPPGVQGQIELRRIVPDNEALCEALMAP